MEATEKKKRAGNPAFVGKKKQEEADKVYEFELIQTYEKYKPRDEKGHLSGSPYPPVYGLANKGIAYCEETHKQRAWRFISTEKSIWVDEQREMSTEEEGYLLSDDANDLAFLNGKLTVRGLEKNKLDALRVQDGFEGKKNQVRKINRIYRLLNPDEEVAKTLDSLDQSFEAEKSAREVSAEDLYEIAASFGINLNRSDDFIKKDLILAAKSNPSSFLLVYAFAVALKDNVISATHLPGQLVWGDSGESIMKVNTTGNVANELATRVMAHDELAKRLLAQLQERPQEPQPE